jgi:glycosyltransferase involved in cell wall biosynthesis
MKPLRIAMLGSRGVPATVGGVERAVEELSVRLAAAGHDVTVYCRTSYHTTRARSYRGVRLRYLPALNTKHLEAISHTLLATLDAMVRRYDVVHIHAIGPSLCAPIARAAGLNVVVTVHSLDFRGGKWGPLARQALQLGAWSAARFPNHTITVSRQLETYFVRRYGSSPTYIPNGVDVPSGRRGPTASERRETGHFLFLGRLVPEKGVHTLIEAYRGVETELPLVIAGPHSHSREYEARLRELATGDPRVTFVGPVHGDAKAELVRLTYAFCQPSTHEGLPIVLLEMMSESICAIVSDIPEHLEVVATGGDRAPAAIVFRAGRIDALRDALRAALDDPELVEAHGVAGRRIVADRYSWSDAAAQLADVYRAVCAGHAAERTTQADF